MTKTIEEAAREYAKYRVGNYDYLGNEYEAYLDGSEDTVKWVMTLPLASRMTEDEKERVREEYSDNKCLIESASLSYVQREIFQKINETLESIFGKDFFKEGE